MSGLREALRELPEAVFADLLDGDDSYLVVIDMPGATAETVDISVESGLVHIEAQREKSVPSEFRYIREDRALFLDVELPMPPDATDEGAEATVERGVLELELPKQSAVSETTIPVHEE